MKKIASLITMFLLLTGCGSIQKNGDLGHRREVEIATSGRQVIKSSVYQTINRENTEEKGYGLYSYLLLRRGTEKNVLVLEELFKTTTSTEEREIKPENLNLVVIPVKDTVQIEDVMENARMNPKATAKEIARELYDYGYAEWLYSTVCQQVDSAIAVKEACGDVADGGPYLFTTTEPLRNDIPTGQKVLVVNFSKTHPGAIPEVLAAYKRQITRQDFADRAELDNWRLDVLNMLLSSADLVPLVKKAFAGDF